MELIVDIKNLNFSWSDAKLFSNLSLGIEKGCFLTLLGPNGSGKTTLAKIIAGMVDCKSYVKIGGLFINNKNLKKIRSITGLVTTNPNNHFVAQTCRENIAISLKKYGYTKVESEKRITTVSQLLDIEHLLDVSPEKLSYGNRQLVNLALILAHNPQILILDNVLEMLDVKLKKKVVQILRKLNNQGVTIINITQNSENILLGTHVAILNDGQMALMSSVIDAFKDLKVFTKNKIDIPFIISLSDKLKYYNVIDKLYFDSKKLVDDLWK